MKLSKYSIGTGDRFGFQGKAQLKSVIKAKEEGINVDIVWNKSHREHTIINTKPEDVLIEAKRAVQELNWNGKYFVDADHINNTNVDLFIDSSNYFTIDVADFIGKKASEEEIKYFVDKYKKFVGNLKIPQRKEPLVISEEKIFTIAEKYLYAIKEAGDIYRNIESKKGKDNFITEISMDETKNPQTPIEILFICASIAEEKIPVQTIAPKFSGEFYKGIDYVGDINQFVKEFEQDIQILNFVIKEFSMNDNLKLSIHSGSDKFSLYGPINQIIKKYDAGIHLKTAGTTWLEELIGLAAAGGEGLKIAKKIYSKAIDRSKELCKPYASVIKINEEELPLPNEVNNYSSEEFVNTLRHNQNLNEYNINFRQLLHVAYKIAAEMGENYTNLLIKYEKSISNNVIENLYNRHIKKLFF